MGTQCIDSRVIVPFSYDRSSCQGSEDYDKLTVALEQQSLSLTVGINPSEDWYLPVMPETLLTLADFIEMALVHPHHSETYSDCWLVADGVEYSVKQAGDEMPVIVSILLRHDVCDPEHDRVRMYLAKNNAYFLVQSMRRIAGIALRYPELEKDENMPELGPKEMQRFQDMLEKVEKIRRKGEDASRRAAQAQE